ncbi:MAG: LAGLIDADG family homing endonuclease, partial [Candidatus Heimdallarchaeota archaeon]|nr:LAGLIDADG family homing endonuclease [Candidatus Heimdallarchaeota archaeon]
RGLFDAYGSIFFLKNSKGPYLDFTNTSKPLLDYFERILLDLNIPLSRYANSISIRAKKAVLLFLRLIKPIKLNDAKKKYANVFFERNDISQLLREINLKNGPAQI